MSTFYDYRYMIDGDKIIFLQNSAAITNNPYLTQTSVFLTPTISDSSAIYLQYTITISGPTDENSDLGLPTTIENAVLQYVKAQLAEERGDEIASTIHMRKFYRLLEKAKRNYSGLKTQVPSPNYTGAIK